MVWFAVRGLVGGSELHRVPIEGELDLHAFQPRDIPSVIDEYVRAAHEAGFREIRLIHGRGIGVQRGVVHRVLSEHPLVERFFDAPESHLGATVAVLSGRRRRTSRSDLPHSEKSGF